MQTSWLSKKQLNLLLLKIQYWLGMVLTYLSWHCILLECWATTFSLPLSQRRMHVWFGAFYLRTHPFPSCFAGLWYNLKTFWCWKGYSFEKIQWKSINCNLQAEVWGWKLMDNEYSQRSTDLLPAPEELLKIIRCNCATDCSTGRCSCQKHGVKCSMACGQCRGSARSNTSLVVEDEEDPDDQQ